jgi:trk system potassium uptake protein TrkA
VLFEVTVAASSPLVGRRLAESRLPASTLVVSILREGEVIFPKGATEIAGGDQLTMLASAGSEEDVRRYFMG